MTDAILRIQKMRDGKTEAIRHEMDTRVQEQLFDDIAALDLAEAVLKDDVRRGGR